MTISMEQILTVVGAASTITTAIFLGAFYLGRLWQRLAAVEVKVEIHDRLIGYGRRESDIITAPK